MIKASLLLSILATVLTLPLNAQVVSVWIPENGKNCSPYEFENNAPWTPPGEPTSAEHFTWDNGDWIRISYSYYEYNTNGLFSAHVLADANNNLKHRWEYTYDAQGNMTEEKLHDFSPGSTPWITKFRAIYTYDAQGRYIEKTRQHYGFNQWYDADKRNRVFESNNFQTLELRREWNDQTNFWDTAYAEQTDFNYNANGYPLESYTKYQFNGSAWQPVNFKKYLLDASNEVIEIQIDGWNGVGYQQQELVRNITWQNQNIRQMAYREYNNWNGSGYSPYVAYNSNQGICARSTEHTYELWDGSAFTLRATTKFEYDVLGAYLEYSFTELDTITGIWSSTVNELGTPTYDANGAIQQYIMQIADSTGVLSNYTMSNYSFNTGLEEANASNAIGIYPSPSNTIANLTIDNIVVNEVQLYSTTGELIETYGANTHQINTTNLPGGIYFVSVLTARGQYLQRKLVVQH